MGPRELVYVAGEDRPVGTDTVTKYEVPAGAAGATAVIVDDPVTAMLVAEKLPVGRAMPASSSTKVTVAPTSNPVPVIVTEVPAVVEPADGFTAETVGTNGENVKMGVLLPIELVYVVGDERPVGVVTMM
jgi:hypothetical protein